MSQDDSRYRTFRCRLHPTKLQTQALHLQQRYQCELYNAALEERIGAWTWERRSVSFFDQCLTLTGLKDVRPEVVASGITVCRGTLKRLDRAYEAFYRRVKGGESPGFPRFKSTSRFDSLEWEDHGGWKNLAQAQRELATKQRGSNRRRRQVEKVVRLHLKIKNQRSNAAHQLSRQLVNDYDFIALEDLKIANMVRAPKGRQDPEQPEAYLPNGARNKAGLHRSIHDAGWGQSSHCCPTRLRVPVGQ